MKIEYIIIDDKRVKRLRCPHHPQHFVKPHKQKLGNSSQCSRCTNIWKGSPRAKRNRAQRWDVEDIRCLIHPGRSCNRSLYVHNGRRRCSSCQVHRADGSRKDSYQRGLNKKHYDEALRLRRSGVTAQSLTGLQLFVRNTGMNILGAF